MLGEFDLQKNVSGDMSIFIKRQDGGDLLIALVYVDDITLFGMLDDITTFKMQIAIHYKISDLGEIPQFPWIAHHLQLFEEDLCYQSKILY